MSPYSQSTPHERRVAVDAVGLMLYEWPGAGPPILFAHANGFHARCWDQVVAHLPGRHCLALDLRGHGRSDKPAPPYHWRAFAEDLVAVGQAQGLRGAIGVGHSLGGYATALAAALAPELFAALLLIDPVIMAREVYGVAFAGGEFAARRRNAWESPEVMFERFRHRAPFNRWRPEILADYCRHGLLPAPGGDGYVLACPPAVEAAIYRGATEAPIYDELARIQVPAVVLRGHPYAHGADDLAGSPTFPGMATHLPHGRDVHLVNHSHFIPMEAPALIAQYVIDLQASATAQ